MLDVIIWGIISVLASAGVTFYKEVLMFKDVADAGYLVDLKRMGELDDKIKEETKSNSFAMIFFPFFGILFSLSNLAKYYQFRGQVLNQLNLFDSLRRMPDYLYKEYAKNPSMLNAFMTVLKDVSNTQYMRVPDKDTGILSEFRYQFNEDFSDVEIIEVKGPAANLPYRKQQEIIIDAWMEVGKQVSYEYGTLENFGKSCEKDKNIELDNSPVNEIPAEEAEISSIKLRNIDEDNSYFEIALKNKEGESIGTFGSPYITDSTNFRREVFGILLACGTNDFLKLGGVDEHSIPITFKSNSRNVVNEIHNANNQMFHLNSQGVYATEQTTQDDRELFEGNITGIVSKSNSLNITIESENFHTVYPTGNLYYGFGYPFISESDNQELLSRACNHYKEYIENILRFFDTDDLLNLGGTPLKKPKVLIERDSTGNIIAIGKEGSESHLRITDNNYKIEKGKLVIAKNKSKKLI